MPKSIDVGDLAEVVTGAVQRALKSKPEEALYRVPPRIICGFIIEPVVLPQVGEGEE